MGVEDEMSKDNYPTPEWLKSIFEGWYDPCPINPEGLREEDGLGGNWSFTTFVNPPYSDPEPWVDQAIVEAKKGKRIVMLLRVDTSTKWFAKLHEAGAHFAWINGRIHFANNGRPANFASMIVFLGGKKE